MPQDVHCIIGASGQLGTELAVTLHNAGETVVLLDIKAPTLPVLLELPFEKVDVRDQAALCAAFGTHHVTHVYHFAAALSARGEQEPQWAWDLNMKGLLHVLDLASSMDSIAQVFWPSSIAVFGPGSGPVAAQSAFRLPGTVYGISKNVGEHWCSWYHQHRGVDVRSVRYPGLIGTLAPPGGGTTDYAVEVFDQLQGPAPYTCFLRADEKLPMMHMDDAVGAALQILSVPRSSLRCNEAYNINAMSFDPQGLFAEIRRHVPGFAVEYAPDFRQDIAAGWPDALNDDMAREDWGWSPKIDLHGLVQSMMAARRLASSVR
ncbi:NAD-dependent epimerase/dehydratase family protein [Flavobacteriales bacterium]|jgi:nucleoside-diphosphate-sugar epimerase|nr:NAD-dependent epimerase/dehydratase family protein [Flavobacteriales bacterium]